MDQNPYAAPSRSSEAVDDSRILAVARHQRALNLCMLVYIACMVSFKFAPEGPLRLVVSFVSIAVLILAVVFAVLLAARLYSTAVAILVGVFTLVPCGGMIGAAYLSSRATALLRRNGYTVGLLGADLSQFTRR